MFYFIKWHSVILSYCSCQPPTMTFNNIEIKRENKISKNIGVLYRASHLLDFKNPKIYFSFSSIYINYASIAWASTFKINLQGILKKQRNKTMLPE